MRAFRGDTLWFTRLTSATLSDSSAILAYEPLVPRRIARVSKLQVLSLMRILLVSVGLSMLLSPIDTPGKLPVLASTMFLLLKPKVEALPSSNLLTELFNY